jgi:septal ring factor EnvC (AmiA/AmiB activator)
MRGWIKNSLLIFLLFLVGMSAQAQDKNQLKRKRQLIQKELKKLNGLLGETKANKRKSEIQLLILRKKIGARQELISAINYEVKYIDKSIHKQEDYIDTLNYQLKTLRIQYSKMVQFAYKNRNATNKLIFIFSSDDFNQAYKRLNYIHGISEYRVYQAKEIEQKQIEVEQKIIALEFEKQSKVLLVNNKRTEHTALEQEKLEKKSLYQTLRSDEKNLKKNITRKKSEARKLENAIKKIIERELKEAMKKNKKSNKFELTPKAKKLSDSFTNNRGKLPWPVGRGTISGKFGNQRHQVFDHLKTINNGVDIITNRGTKARAVFKGKVVAVIVLPGDKNAVLIQHGSYFTMYSNLSSVYVKKGDELDIQEEIGKIKTDENGKTELHFEIWNGNTKQNPGLWISKK